MRIYFGKKEAIRILSVFCWDVSCDEASGIIQSQVLTCMGCFITRAWKVHFEAFPRTLWFLRLLSSKDGSHR